MNDSLENYIRRLERMRMDAEKPKGKDYLIRVQYFDEEITKDGERREVPVPCRYPEPDFSECETQPNGNRYLVQYPIEEE